MYLKTLSFILWWSILLERVVKTFDHWNFLDLLANIMLGSYSNQPHKDSVVLNVQCVVDVLLFMFILSTLPVVCMRTYMQIYFCGCAESREILGRYTFT